MNLPIVLREEAENEFDEAFDFYDSRQQGIGAKFLTEVERVFVRISQFPRLQPSYLMTYEKRLFATFLIAFTIARFRIASK